MKEDMFLELLEKRRSCRRFSDRAIGEEELKRLLLAANGAPVGSNLNEDIRLTVVRDRAGLDELAIAMKRRREDKEKRDNSAPVQYVQPFSNALFFGLYKSLINNSNNFIKS